MTDPLMKYLSGNDLTRFYNTPLNPVDEAMFQFYAANPYANPSRRNLLNDLYDYDVRGYWKENNSPDARGHFSDRFKKPNHPTFSVESQYNGSLGNQGGQWVEDGYIPSEQQGGNNMAFLARYFAEREPGQKLYPPQGALARMVMSK